MGMEYELKYAATQAQLLALRQTFGEPEAVYRMRTDYYDTPTGQLSAQRYTLRLRLENEEPVYTCKCPLAGNARGEWECRADSLEAAIPLLLDQGAPSALAEVDVQSLCVTCGARFTRQTYTVTTPEAVLELALDDGVLLGGSRELPLQEVEVELKSGPPQAAEAFARGLAAHYQLKPQPLSKHQRASRLGKENI